MGPGVKFGEIVRVMCRGGNLQHQLRRAILRGDESRAAWYARELARFNALLQTSTDPVRRYILNELRNSGSYGIGECVDCFPERRRVAELDLYAPIVASEFSESAVAVCSQNGDID